jgi:hypothetical protein
VADKLLNDGPFHLQLIIAMNSSTGVTFTAWYAHLCEAMINDK